MKLDNDNYAIWSGSFFTVQILYSRAGVSQHIWIENEKTAFLIDCGDGLLRDNIARKLDLNKLAAILITHGHYDHIGGLYSLLGFLRMIGHNEKLNICFPENCREAEGIVSEFKRIYEFSTKFPIEYQSLKGNTRVTIDGVDIDTFPVTHYGSISGASLTEQLPAFGYRISYKGESIAITGDCGTERFDDKLIKDADLAIIESTFRDNPDITEETTQKVHLTESIANAYGQLAKEFILVHKAYR